MQKQDGECLVSHHPASKLFNNQKIVVAACQIKTFIKSFNVFVENSISIEKPFHNAESSLISALKKVDRPI